MTNQIAASATPEDVLYKRLMDSTIAKTELEHFAARRIKKLEEELKDERLEAMDAASRYDAY